MISFPTLLEVLSVDDERARATETIIDANTVQDGMPIAIPVSKVTATNIEQATTVATTMTSQQQNIPQVVQSIPLQKKFEQLNTTKKVLRLHGSNTVGEVLAPTLIEAFYKQQVGVEVKRVLGGADVESSLKIFLPDQDLISIEVHAHGSSMAFKDLMKAETDMGMASRAIKPQEVADLKPMYGDFSAQGSEFVIVLDGLAVIVHPANPITALSTDKVAKLFSGEISNWAQIGG